MGVRVTKYNQRNKLEFIKLPHNNSKQFGMEYLISETNSVLHIKTRNKNSFENRDIRTKITNNWSSVNYYISRKPIGILISDTNSVSHMKTRIHMKTMTKQISQTTDIM